jgi:NAD(P)-dependent dehydrogenase (short-subunit alcohol dehydrogenase family)
VNNFGLYIPWGTHIHKFSNAQVRDFVLSNVLPQTILSIRLAAKMQNRKKRSGIINLSSFAAEYG